MQAKFARAAVDRYDEIEDLLWTCGQYNTRSAGAWLRHRYICLHTTSGILRCKSVHHAELSDFVPLRIKKPDDPHPLFLMITQLAFGKLCMIYCTLYCWFLLLLTTATSKFFAQLTSKARQTMDASCMGVPHGT